MHIEPPVMAIVVVLGLVLGQRAPLSEAEESNVWVARFSSQPVGLPSEAWQLQDLSHHRRTQYGVIRHDGQLVLKAESDQSASILVRRIRIDPVRYRHVEWIWQIDRVIPQGRWSEKDGDDFAGRLFVLFEKARSAWSFFGRVITKGGAGLPGRSLNYVWANHAPVDAMIRSPYSDRVVMIAVESGDTREGT